MDTRTIYEAVGKLYGFLQNFENDIKVSPLTVTRTLYLQS
jgi:hypothetical protein